jgi:hypothetical protein
LEDRDKKIESVFCDRFREILPPLFKSDPAPVVLIQGSVPAISKVPIEGAISEVSEMSFSGSVPEVQIDASIPNEVEETLKDQFMFNSTNTV